MKPSQIVKNSRYEASAVPGTIYVVRNVVRVKGRGGTVDYWVEECAADPSMIGKECNATLDDFAQRVKLPLMAASLK